MIDWTKPKEYVRKSDNQPIHKVLSISKNQVILSFLDDSGKQQIEIYNLDGTFFMNHNPSIHDIIKRKYKLKVLFAPNCAGKSTYLNKKYTLSSVQIIKRYTDAPEKNNGLQNEDVVYITKKDFDLLILKIPISFKTINHRCAIDFREIIKITKHHDCILSTSTIEFVILLKELCKKYKLLSEFCFWLPPKKNIISRINKVILQLQKNEKQNKQSIERYKKKLKHINFYYDEKETLKQYFDVFLESEQINF